MTIKTREELATIFADNSDQEIEAVDMRDLIASIPLAAEFAEGDNITIDLTDNILTIGADLTDLATPLNDIESNTNRLVLAAVSDPITLGVDATLQSLAAAVTGLKRIAVIPSDDAVGYYAFDKAATGSTAPLPTYAFDRPIDATNYAKIHLYGTAGTVVIEQYN